MKKFVCFWSVFLFTFYSNALAIAQDQRIYTDSIHKQIDELNSKGNYFRNQTDFKSAFDLHYKALVLARDYKDTLGIVFSYNNIANDLRRSDANEQAVSYYLQVLKMIDGNPSYLKSQTIAMNGLGNIFLTLEKPDQALDYFNEALTIETGLKSNLGIAINYANIGEVYFQKEEFDLAYEFYQKSFEENLKISNKVGQAICLSAFSRINLEKGDLVKAINFANEAISMISGTNDIYHLLRFEQLLMEIYIKSNQLQAARALIQSLLNHSQQLSSAIEFKNSYLLIVELYKKLKDYPKAVEAQDKLMAYNDSILKTSNDLVILEQQKKYQTEKILQQIRILEDQNQLDIKTRNNQILIFSFVLLLFIVLMGYLILRNRQKKLLNDELKELNELRNRFFNHISHEFKTPLTLIMGPVSQLKNSIQSNEQLESLNLIEKNANSLYQLVVQILNINKLESKSFEVYYQDGYLDLLVEQLSENFKFQTKQKSIELTKELKPSKLLKIDKAIVTMIVNNLLSNALKYTPKGGRILLKGDIVNSIYKLQIQNDIDDSIIDVNRLFEKYYSKKKLYQEGTGLGLHLVKELCDLYETKIEVDYKVNESLSFQLYFPAQYSSTPLEELELSTEDTYITEAVESNELPLMLVVEDNFDMATYIKSLFVNNYRILIAANGKEGIDLAIENSPAIIISDVMMPLVNGIELCKKLKKNPITNHIPIILLSANSKEQTMVQGLKNNCDDYMFKPFAKDVLIAKVTNLVNLRRVLVEKYRTNLQYASFKKLLNFEDSFHTQILELIENEISDPNFNIDFLCRSLHMSRSQLHRKLKAVFDMSATEFINFHRLKIAADLLLNSNLNVTEVCFECGYSSPSYFSKQFKLFFGTSPQSYVKEYKSR